MPRLGKPRTLLPWEMKQVRMYQASGRGRGVVPQEKERAVETRRRSTESIARGYWVPDPRTGIYYPKGCEWVMEDVPEGAAAFRQSYWLRSLDGVEKPTPPDSPPRDDIFDHPFLNA